jgi:hypothetical protein
MAMKQESKLTVANAMEAELRTYCYIVSHSRSNSTRAFNPAPNKTVRQADCSPALTEQRKRYEQQSVHDPVRVLRF